MMNIEVDLRGHLMPIRDQGRRQTCMAFASSDANAMVDSRPMSNLSVEYAHYSACKRMPQFQPANGTSDYAMFEALRIDGQPPEQDWPYLAVLPNDLADYHPPVILSGLVRHAGERIQSLDEAEAALRLGWPVIMGLTLSDSFYHLASTTVLEVIQISPALAVMQCLVWAYSQMPPEPAFSFGIPGELSGPIVGTV